MSKKKKKAQKAEQPLGDPITVSSPVEEILHPKVNYRSSQDPARSEDEAEALIAEIGVVMGARIDVGNRYARKMELARRERQQTMKPLERHLDMLIGALLPYLNANKLALTRGSQTVSFEAGTVGWRKSPPMLLVVDNEALLGKLKALKLKRFIRIRESVNRRAILDEPGILEKLEGVTIIQQRRMFIHPKDRALLRLDESGKRLREKRKRRY